MNIKIIYTTENTPESSLRDSMTSEDYFLVYNYDYVSVGNFRLVRYYNNLDFYVPKFDGPYSKKLNSIFSYVSNININKNNSDPNRATEIGGNCQALSIIFWKCCKDNYIDCRIVDNESGDHVYNVVSINNQKYKIDLIDHRMEVIDE